MGSGDAPPARLSGVQRRFAQRRFCEHRAGLPTIGWNGSAERRRAVAALLDDGTLIWCVPDRLRLDNGSS